MQWNNSENAGFTTGEPWIKVNPNYKEINAEEQAEDPNSILNYYKKLIALRKSDCSQIRISIGWSSLKTLDISKI